jgi:putative ABC transport system ATP-binding protein
MLIPKKSFAAELSQARNRNENYFEERYVMKALSAKGISRSYGGTNVLSDFSLDIDEGGFEVLMGPSGSGKSTFLHIAGGLLEADAGSLEIGGHDVVKMSDAESAKFRRRNVGIVFQSFNLLPSKSVKENILLPLKLDRTSKKEISSVEPRLNALSEILGISNLMSKKTEMLSGGEKQRVAVARALIASPSVVLADEPTGNLDVKTSHELCELFKKLNETEKSAFLIVTHDPVVAASAKKIHFLKDGKIVRSIASPCSPAEISSLYLEIYG